MQLSLWYHLALNQNAISCLVRPYLEKKNSINLSFCGVLLPPPPPHPPIQLFRNLVSKLWGGQTSRRLYVKQIPLLSVSVQTDSFINSVNWQRRGSDE